MTRDPKRVPRLRDVDTGEQSAQLRFTIMVLLPGMIMLHMLEAMLWPNGPVALLTVLNFALLVLLSRLIWPVLSGGSAMLVNGLLSAGGEARTVEYSEVEALIAQGRHQEALEMYRAIADAVPDADVRLRLGDLMQLHFRDAAAAEAAYLAARQASPTPAQESRIINSLIDLYRGSGNRAGMKAELTRFARLHAGSAIGEQAREAVRRMAREELDGA